MRNRVETRAAFCLDQIPDKNHHYTITPSHVALPLRIVETAVGLATSALTHITLSYQPLLTSQAARRPATIRKRGGQIGASSAIVVGLGHVERESHPHPGPGQ